VIAGTLAMAGIPAQANVRSQALYARGLIPFSNGQWEQAYELFDHAVQADRGDAVALYYRGLSEARRGIPAAAIQDFEQALRLNPNLWHAPLDLGIAYLDAAQFNDAKTWLERAYQRGSERLTAAFFLGVALYRLGDDAAALPYLNEAKADPELRSAAQYYGGLALAHQGNTEAARTEMAAVAREQPQSEIGKAAQGFTTGRAPAARPQETKKPWSVYGKVGFEYDSNVVIAPSDFISRKDDGRAVVAAGGGYTLLDMDQGTLRAGYDFYQSVHFEFTEFDLQEHHVHVDAASAPGTISYGLSGIYGFDALDYQSFFQEVSGLPWVAFAESKEAATQFYYTIRARDFLRKPFDPGRDGINQALGARQYFTLGSPDRVMSLGYQFDFEDTISSGPMGRDFQYKGNQGDIDLSFPILDLAQIQVGYLFRVEDYQFPNSRAAFQVRRHDSTHQFAVAAVHALTENLALTFDLLGILNNSNIPNFDYDRFIVSGGIRAIF